MRHALLYSVLAALLGGCVVVPYGYRDYDDGYRYRSYYSPRYTYPGYYGYYSYGYPRSYGYYGYGFRYQDRGG